MKHLAHNLFHSGKHGKHDPKAHDYGATNRNGTLSHNPDALCAGASYATASAGMSEAQTLPIKLCAIAAAGFGLTELAWMDLEAYARNEYVKLGGKGKNGYKETDNAGRGDVETLVRAAEEVHKLCTKLHLKILAVMPFSRFEGYEDEAKREEGLQRARTWFRVMKALNCQILQVGSSDDPDISPDPDVMARDLQALADEAAKCEPPISIAYEMWAWGTYVNTWEHCADICVRVDRPNFGLCLDTFQISATYYKSYLITPDLPYPAPRQVPPLLQTSLTALKRILGDAALRDRIFYLQVSDAVWPPSGKLRAEGKPPLYEWSDGWRVLPAEGLYVGDGGKEKWKELGAPRGVLPVLEVLKAVLETGWRGVWSYEVFYPPSHSASDTEVPAHWARAAKACHAQLLKRLAAGEPKHDEEDTKDD